MKLQVRKLVSQLVRVVKSNLVFDVTKRGKLVHIRIRVFILTFSFYEMGLNKATIRLEISWGWS
jgi:hypothetical protein